jgi:hypothetical protein
MRMWMVAPSIMCRQHLLGEHVETHMFLGSAQRRRNVTGFLDNNLLEPASLAARHDELVQEMRERGYNHKSPLSPEEAGAALAYLPADQYHVQIARPEALTDLLERCPNCRARQQEVAQ